MEFEETNATPEPTETPAPPQQPEIDPSVALNILAQQYGTTPEFIEGAVRTQEDNRRIDAELRRKQRELDVRDAMLRDREAMRHQAPPQSYDDADPISRRILMGQDEITRRLDERDRKEQESMDRASRARELEFEFDRGYESVMRGVPSQNQIERDRFFGTMLKIYPPGPDGDLPAGITVDMALDTTARYLGLQPNGGPVGYAAPRMAPSRDPRQQIVIPAGQNGTPPDQQAGDQPPQIRAGEPQEQFDARARVWWENKFGGKRHQQIMRDGAKFSSG